MYPSYPAGIDPAVVRPRRRWFVVAGVIALVGVIGCGIFIGELLSTLNRAKPVATFEAGQAVTVSLVASPRPAIYTDAGSTPGTCTVTSGSGQAVPLNPHTTSGTLVFGAQRWAVSYDIEVPSAGSYRVSCTGPAAAYGVGTPPSTSEFVGVLLGLVLVPVVAIGIAIIITVVVAVRRGRHRRRLLAEAYPRPY